MGPPNAGTPCLLGTRFLSQSLFLQLCAWFASLRIDSGRQGVVHPPLVEFLLKLFSKVSKILALDLKLAWWEAPRTVC